MINFVTVLHFVGFTANVLLAAFIIGRNPKALVNRVCFLLIATFAFWCFYSARLTMADNLEDAMFFINMSSIGWAFMPVASLWFCLALDNKEKILKNWAFIAGTILVAAVFVYAQWAGELFYTCVPASWGWTPIWKMSAAAYAYYLYNIVIAGILIYLLIDFGRKAKSHSQKMQAKILLITGIIAMALSSMTDIIFRIFDIRAVPDIADVIFVIWGLGIVHAVFKYGLMSLTPGVAAETILNTISDSIILLDTRMQIVYTNRATVALLGYSEKELLGAHFNSVVTDKKTAEDLLKETLQAGSVNHELSYLSKSGKPIPVLIATSTIYNSEHNNIGIALSVKDITSRKQIEEALRESEEKYRLVIENAREGICIAVDGFCIFANRGTSEITGYSLVEFTSKPFIEFVHPDDRSRIADSYSRWVSGTEAATSYTFRCISKSGEIRWMELSAVPIMWNGRQAAMSLMTDITERRQLEEEQQRVEKLESIGLLAGGIAHDFNNILTAILGNISLARLDAPPGSEVNENLEQAEKASLRAKELTKQLLTFSKGGAPMMKPASLTELIKNIGDSTLRGSNVKCTYSIPDDLWQAKIDEGQVSQAIHNIVINAQQAMPSGGNIELTAENMALQESKSLGRELPLKAGNYIRIAITDHGKGIPSKYLPKIFDPFFTTKQGNGGLGLATAFSIARRHGGHLSVESKPGSGSTFYLYLPSSSRMSSAGQGKKEPAQSDGKVRILVMDDEKGIRTVAGRMLKNMGYEDNEFAEDGTEAVKLYTEAMKSGRPFTVVILDLSVPGGMGGKDALDQLLKIDPRVKAIVSSGSPNESVMSDYSQYGFSGRVAKPYTSEEFGQAIRDVTG